ncbi:hypothetical protein [Microbacterium karelineae]|uniref:hypothetical protein n=1 Tax=Microbacterium karelineae TaxID=2654283 RepID=UPI0018D29217|nr:hypothetical protein [Microbacterium karelineae]
MYANPTIALIQYDEHVRTAERRIAAERLIHERAMHDRTDLAAPARRGPSLRARLRARLRAALARVAGRMAA